MEHLDMVEKLRGRANVSYEEAKAALEEANWDMLDAMVLLERDGKVNAAAAAPFTTKEEPKRSAAKDKDGLLARFFKGLGALLHTGNINQLVVEKEGKELFSLPITVLVLMLIFMFWITLPLLLIGLFCGYRYNFRGPNLGREDVNRAMDKASAMADNIKREVVKEVGSKKDRQDDSGEVK